MAAEHLPAPWVSSVIGGWEAKRKNIQEVCIQEAMRETGGTGGRTWGEYGEEYEKNMGENMYKDMTENMGGGIGRRIWGERGARKSGRIWGSLCRTRKNTWET